MQNQHVHHESYAHTMYSIQQADEIRQIEANLKFMAKPYNVHRRIKLQKQAKNDIEQVITNSNDNPKIDTMNLQGASNLACLNTEFRDRKIGFIKIVSEKSLKNQKVKRKSNFVAERRDSLLFQGKSEASEKNRSPVLNLKRSTSKEIKTLKKKRKKEIKMKRTLTKKQFKAEQRQVKMERKMRKILQKRMKLTRRKADKQRKRAEKMRRIQNKVEKVFKTIYIHLKRFFDIVGLCLGLTLIVLGIFTTGTPLIPMVLIGFILALLGIGSLSIKFVRKAQISRRAEKYKNSYLNTMQVKSKPNEVQVII